MSLAALVAPDWTRAIPAAGRDLSQQDSRTGQPFVAEQERDLGAESALVDAGGATFGGPHRIAAQPAVGERLGLSAATEFVRELVHQLVEELGPKSEAAREAQQFRGGGGRTRGGRMGHRWFGAGQSGPVLPHDAVPRRLVHRPG
jgi:hypothetical protein